MIEETLLQYGVLGLWTASLIAEKILFQKKLIKSLDQLRDTITKHL